MRYEDLKKITLEKKLIAFENKLVNVKAEYH